MRSIRPPREVSSDPSRSWSRAALPLAGLLTAGLATLSLTTPRESLEADSLDLDDPDADGLTNAQELVQQTSPTCMDTDSDGYSDSEELARGSCPFAAHNVPLPGDSALALTARGEAGKVHIVMLAYFTDGRLDNKVFDFGAVLRDGAMVQIPSAHLLANSTESIHPTLDGAGHVAVVQFEVNPGPIVMLEHLSLFATMSVLGQGYISAAAVVDLFSTPSGVVLKSGPSYESVSGNRGQGGGAGSIYQPIPPADGLPMDWLPGKICRQKTSPVAYENGVVLTRVMSAECSDGWDAHCSPADCKASVGDEFATVDPVGLVGG